MKAVAVFLFALVALVAAQDTLLTYPMTQFAILSGDQQSVVNPSTYSGGAIVSYDENTMTLWYLLIHTVPTVTAAHIHGPAYPGNDANVLFTLPSTASGTNSSFQLTSTQATYLTTGQLYFNIHTTAYPSGEIRGQILNSGQSTSQLNAANDGANSTANGWSLLSYNSMSQLWNWNITHDVSSSGVTAMHLHGPADDANTAGVEVPIATSNAAAQSPVVGSATFTGTTPVDYSSGLTYINIHSQAYPNGEVRGQVYYPNVNYAIGLDGSQASTPSTNLGIAIISISTDSSVANVFVISTIDDADITAMHIHAAAAVGATANPVISLDPYQVSENFYLVSNSTIAGWLSTGMAYVNVHTTAYSSGEIRGQVVPLGTAAQPVTSTSTTGSSAAHHVAYSALVLLCSILAVLML